MTWDCRPQSAGAETGALVGTGGKGTSCMATKMMPEKWYQYLEGTKHPPSYLCTGQEVRWNQPNQKHQDSKTTPAWGVIATGCGETSLS